MNSEPEKVAGEFESLRQSLEKVVEESRKRLESMKREGGHFEPLQLRPANRLFGQSSYPFREAFLRCTQDVWLAPLEKIAFDKDPESARKHINDWVEQQTAKRIVNLLPARSVNAGTRLVLVNALYFKAAWEDDFNPEATKQLPFFVSVETPVKVPTMFRNAHFGYRRQSGYTAATIPYTGGELQFLIIIPDSKDGLPALVKSLSGAELTGLSKLDDDREVQLYLPKFRIASPTMPLEKHLQSLGMNAPFDVPPGSADFSRMGPRDPRERLVLSDVFHKAFLALDEHGTEAAAATAVALGLPGAIKEKPEPVELRIDHPFLFAIQHRSSGICLFLGRMSDPRG